MNRDALKDLCLRYLDGDLSGKEIDDFSQLIAESQEAARLLARLAIFDSRLETTTALQGGIGVLEQWLDRSADRALATDKVHPHQSTFKQASELLGYVLLEAAKTKPAKWLYSLAAVLLLSFVAWQVWGPSTSPQHQHQHQPPPSLAQDKEVVPASPVVAILTAEHDARWQSASGASPPDVGDALRSGQHLTLTAGFAEITTRRGAVALLKAPATIELLDNDNALRLHVGKLVGICESESSKGFLVRAPHMDVTDLGTRFGIDSSKPSATEVHVFDGIISVSSPSRFGATGEQIELIAGEAIRATDGSIEQKRFVSRADLFQSIAPPVWVALAGTGQGLSEGQVDPAWRVVALNGQPLETLGEMVVHQRPLEFRDRLIPNDPAASQWIASEVEYLQATGQGDVFTVRRAIELPKGIAPGNAQLRLRFDADDRLLQVRINGKIFIPPPTDLADDHPGLTSFTIPVTLLKGANTAEFDVLDAVRDGGSKWFMRLEWAIDQNSVPLSESLE